MEAEMLNAAIPCGTVSLSACLFCMHILVLISQRFYMVDVYFFIDLRHRNLLCSNDSLHDRKIESK